MLPSTASPTGQVDRRSDPPDDDRTRLAARIRRLRVEAGLSQRSVAKHALVHEQTLRRWEQGVTAPDAVRLPILARALDAPIGALFDPWVIAEVRLEPETLARLRAQGDPAVREVAAQMGVAVQSVLRGAAAAHGRDVRVRREPRRNPSADAVGARLAAARLARQDAAERGRPEPIVMEW